MKQTIQKHQKLPFWKPLIAVGMMLLLVWLTSINFLYSTSNDTQALIGCMDATEDSEEGACPISNSPTGPDEKSPDAPPVSLLEEFIHEHPHTEHSLWVDMLFQHKVHEAEKLTVVHPESFSPPPEV